MGVPKPAGIEAGPYRRESGDGPTVDAACTLPEFFEPASLRGLGTALVWSGVSPQPLAADSASGAIVLQYLNEGGWTGWICFDMLPGALRLAGLSSGSGQPQYFGSTDDGYLYVRRGAVGGYSPWAFFSLPTHDTFVTDVAAVTTTNPSVWIATGESVFVRRMLGKNAEGGYGVWRALPTVGAVLLSAMADSSGFERVVAATLSGEILTTRQEIAGDDSSYGPWVSLGKPPAKYRDLDIALVQNTERIFVLTTDGLVLTGAVDTLAWSVLDGVASFDSPLVALSLQVMKDGSSYLLGVTAKGKLATLAWWA